MDDVPELKDRGSENGAPQRAPFFTYTEKNKTVSRGNSAADRADLDCGEVFSVKENRETIVILKQKIYEHFSAVR